MSNSTLDIALGVGNFRREYSNIVHSLTAIPHIDPLVEKLTDPKTFNTRFSQLGTAVKHAFHAAGDIAIRDKRYLEGFLTGYSNPVVCETFKYKDPSLYLGLNVYDTNGKPLTFPEQRVMYSIQKTSSLNNQAVFPWVFKNGVLLDDDDYTLTNTAYGIKCFVKATKIAEDDEITVTINRVFSTSEKFYVKYPVTTAVSKLSILVPVKELGDFYEKRYTKVMYKNKGVWTNVPEHCLVRDIDVTGNTLRIDIRNFTLAAGSSVFVFNTLKSARFDWTVNVAADGLIPAKPLTTSSSTEALLPLPCKLADDLDIFCNGYKLIPEVHFNLDYSITTSGERVGGIRFLFNATPGSILEFKVFKNESVHYPDSNTFSIAELHPTGVEGRGKEEGLAPLAFMPGISNVSIGGKTVHNSNIRALHRDILEINTKLGLFQDFHYSNRVVYTTDISAVIEAGRRNISESDTTLEWMGWKNVLDNLRGSKRYFYNVEQDNITTNTSIKDVKSATVGQLIKFTELNLSSDNEYTPSLTEFEFDPNEPISTSYGMDWFGSSGFTIDANVTFDDEGLPPVVTEFDCNKPLVFK